HCLGDCTGISFIDSTTLKSCHYKRENNTDFFVDLAQKSYGILGSFYGLNYTLYELTKEKLLSLCPYQYMLAIENHS
uniref:transposase n=1 Tax=uncultured Polaribacter sp. TaxID=174711 RepID=UPI0026114DE8